MKRDEIVGGLAVSTEDNKALARRAIDVINAGDLSLVEEVFASDYVYTSPGVPEVHGPEGMKEFISGYRAGFPDLVLTVDEQIAEDDKVLTRWTATGTHQGDFMDIAPTGKRMTINGLILSRCANGKIVADFEVLDALGMLQQLGVIPAAEETTVTA